MKHSEALQLGPGPRLDLHVAAILGYPVWDGRKEPLPKSAKATDPFVLITEDGMYRYGVDDDEDETDPWEPSRRRASAMGLFLQHPGYLRFERLSDVLNPGRQSWQCAFLRGRQYAVASDDACLAIVRSLILHDMITRERTEVDAVAWSTGKTKKKAKTKKTARR